MQSVMHAIVVLDIFYAILVLTLVTSCHTLKLSLAMVFAQRKSHVDSVFQFQKGKGK